jgi:hypothetical protein
MKKKIKRLAIFIVTTLLMVPVVESINETFPDTPSSITTQLARFIVSFIVSILI